MSLALVATLVAEAGKEIPDSFLQSVVGQLHLAEAKDVRTVWFTDHQAADIFFKVKHDRPKAGQLVADQPFDCIIQVADHRQKKLLVADMESTIIEQEMLDELAGAIGLRDKVAAITARAMNGELDFIAAIKERVALLQGLPVKVLDDAAKKITLMPGAVELLKGMKARGAVAWLVSGGFTYFAEPIAKQLGFDRVFANELIIRDGILTGEVAEPILDKTSKKSLLDKACAENKLSLQQTVTVGDGANDVPMLSASNDAGGLGVAFRAKPNVRAVVPHQVNFGDLRVMLYAQGLKA
jgi:phosphoserine phosphatase